MASLVLTGDTSGQVTLAAPAVAGTTTLTLPATTGSVIGSNSSGDIQFNSGYGSVATAYGCRAWVNFNGTTASPSTIRGSGNVTSVTKNGTGLYTVNFTNAMPDANYSIQVAVNSSVSYNQFAMLSGSPTTTSVGVRANASTTTGTNEDSSIVCVAIFR